MRVVGTKGSASLDLYNNQRVEIYGDRGVAFRHPNHLFREHGELFLDYAAAREHGAATCCADEIDGLRTVELVFAAYESAETAQRTSVRQWQSE